MIRLVVPLQVTICGLARGAVDSVHLPGDPIQRSESIIHPTSHQQLNLGTLDMVISNKSITRPGVVNTNAVAPRSSKSWPLQAAASPANQAPLRRGMA